MNDTVSKTVESNMAHIAACLSLLDFKLDLEIQRMRASDPTTDDGLNGLFVTDDQIDAMIARTKSTSLHGQNGSLEVDLEYD